MTLTWLPPLGQEEESVERILLPVAELLSCCEDIMSLW